MVATTEARDEKSPFFQGGSSQRTVSQADFHGTSSTFGFHIVLRAGVHGSVGTKAEAPRGRAPSQVLLAAMQRSCVPGGPSNAAAQALSEGAAARVSELPRFLYAAHPSATLLLCALRGGRSPQGPRREAIATHVQRLHKAVQTKAE
jgi:uncharacterized membrane protein